MVTIFCDHCVDDHRVTRQTLLYDARRKLRHYNAGTFSAGAFFAFGRFFYSEQDNDHTNQPLMLRPEASKDGT
jgi:hypothetical protein